MGKKDVLNKNNKNYSEVSLKDKQIREFIYLTEGAKLQEIGDIFGLTRMRIFQIEKSILKKIRNEFGEELKNYL